MLFVLELAKVTQAFYYSLFIERLSMAGQPRGKVTKTLQKNQAQNIDSRHAIDGLFHILYDELHRIAESFMCSEVKHHMLQPAALVNETYIKLTGGGTGEWKSRAQFLRIAAHAMRLVLVDYARKRLAAKRGGNHIHVTLQENLAGRRHPEVSIVELSDALEKLSALDQRAGQVVEMRVFAGMRSNEIARALLVSKTTVSNDWRFARTWLSRELGKVI